MSPEQSQLFGPAPANWYGSPIWSRANATALAACALFGGPAEVGADATGDDGAGFCEAPDPEDDPPAPEEEPEDDPLDPDEDDPDEDDPLDEDPLDPDEDDPEDAVAPDPDDPEPPPLGAVLPAAFACCAA